MRGLSRVIKHGRFRLLVLMFMLLAVVLGAVIVPIESRYKNANILNEEDGVWWAVTTMTGVGYGDVYPVSSTGRVVGVILEIIGVVVFGLIVGYIAVEIFGAKDKFYWSRLDKRLDKLEKQLERIEKGQRFVVEAVDGEE